MVKVFALKLFLRTSTSVIFAMAMIRRAHFFPVSKLFTVFLAVTLALPQAYSQPQQNQDPDISIEEPLDLQIQLTSAELGLEGSQESLPPISLDISDPKPAHEITASEISSGNQIYMISAQLFEKIRDHIDIRSWQALKTKTQHIYGYMAAGTPATAQRIAQAFRHPFKSDENVTIVTTFMGASSTILSFTLGNWSAGDNDALHLFKQGVILLSLSILYRANMNTFGDFFTYKGWTLSEVRKNKALGESLGTDSLGNRLLKNSLVSFFFLLAASLGDDSSSQSKKDPIESKDFVLANVEYTFANFVDSLLTRVMISKKANSQSANPEMLALKKNKITFTIKAISIALSGILNFLVAHALSGNFKAHLALATVGGAVVLNEYFASRRYKKASENLSCPAVFKN